jgi:hypothetical protein
MMQGAELRTVLCFALQLLAQLMAFTLLQLLALPRFGTRELYVAVLNNLIVMVAGFTAGVVAARRL